MHLSEDRLQKRIRKLTWMRDPKEAEDIERRERTLNHIDNRGYFADKEQRQLVLDHRQVQNRVLNKMYGVQEFMPNQIITPKAMKPMLRNNKVRFQPIVDYAFLKQQQFYNGNQWLVCDLDGRLYSVLPKSSYDIRFDDYSKAIIIDERYIVSEVDITEFAFNELKKSLDVELKRVAVPIEIDVGLKDESKLDVKTKDLRDKVSKSGEILVPLKTAIGELQTEWDINADYINEYDFIKTVGKRGKSNNFLYIAKKKEIAAKSAAKWAAQYVAYVSDELKAHNVVLFHDILEMGLSKYMQNVEDGATNLSKIYSPENEPKIQESIDEVIEMKALIDDFKNTNLVDKLLINAATKKQVKLKNHSQFVLNYPNLFSQ